MLLRFVLSQVSEARPGAPGEDVSGGEGVSGRTVRKTGIRDQGSALDISDFV